jgi:hypothetical protein
LLASAPTLAGVADTPVPRFANGQQGHVLALYAGVVKRNRLQTDFVCTVTDPSPVDIGVEVFGADGTRLNDLSTGAGAVLGVPAGQTVTIGLGATAAFLESTVIALPSVAQGSARIVTTSDLVQCVAVLVDALAAPPTALATLSSGTTLRPASNPALPMARFADEQSASHAAVVPGIVKRNGINTDILCTSLATQPIDIGVQVFNAAGEIQNDIGAGNGAVLAVAPGATVTFGTTGTATLLETTVIAVAGVAQGLARVVASSGDVMCSALVLDALLAPPVALSELRVFAEDGTSPPPTLTPTVTASATATPILPTRTPPPTLPPLVGCTGDCSDNGRVTVDEMVTGVRIALGNLTVGACEEFDMNGDTRVGVSELVRAINVLLYGCIP